VRSPRFSLTFSILASLACLLILTWILFSLPAFITAERDLYGQKSEHARMLLASFVNQLPDELPTYPNSILPLSSPAALYASKLADESAFMRLTLLDANGKVIYSVGRDAVDTYSPFFKNEGEGSSILGKDESVARIMVVTRKGAVVGRAGLVLSLAPEKGRLDRARSLFFSYFAIDFILLLAFGSYILSRIVVKPVNRLLSATDRITSGVYGTKVEVTGALELARLAESFNTMSVALGQKQAEVASHVEAVEKANIDLRQAREEAVRSEKMASVGLLAAGTAHEIGTPLASIIGYAELLGAEVEKNQVQADYVRRILDSSNRIDRIVRGLLDYARPRTPSADLIDASSLVRETIDMLQHQGVFKQCRVEASYEGELPPVKVDVYQLQQVLINLLLNAVDALPADGGRIMVSVRLGRRTDFDENREIPLRIDVLDNGGGIAKENITRIFDPFFTTKDPGRGTGLGLAISARIIESFSGRITVKSEPCKGSCFSVLLPVNNSRWSA
jgi:two-component system, NtrC family, sensor kinase